MRTWHDKNIQFTVFYVLLRSGLGFRKLSTLIIFSQMSCFPINFEWWLEVWGAIEKFSDNPGQKILELYNVLAQIRFPTSKTKIDIEFNKPGIQVALRNSVQQKTLDLRKLEILEKFQIEWRLSLVPSHFQKLDFGNCKQKACRNGNLSKLSSPVQILLNFYFVPKILFKIL